MDGHSKTALMVAAYRARKIAAGSISFIDDDPWAQFFSGDEGETLAKAFDKKFPHMTLWIALRTRYLDLQVKRAIKNGFTQIIILGAGFDTRAARLNNNGVQFFEVDHPDTQKEKLARIEKLTDYPKNSALLVPCDFENSTVSEALENSDFNPALESCILWEGVVPYLTKPAISKTLFDLRHTTHPRSILFFDYLGKRMAEGEKIRPKDEAARKYVRNLGEPLRFGTNDILPILAKEGYEQVRSSSFDELCLSMTGTYDRKREFRFQWIAAASVANKEFIWS